MQRTDIPRYAYELAKANDGVGRLVGGDKERASQQYVLTTTGAAGDDPEARRRGTATGDTDDQGPSGTEGAEVGGRADL